MQKRMTVRQLLRSDLDIDTANDVTDELYCAFVGPAVLTNKGLNMFNDILNVEGDVVCNDMCSTVVFEIAGFPDWERKDYLLRKLFLVCSGYGYNSGLIREVW